MFNLIWQESGQEPRSLFTVNTPLGQGDILRMLEPTFAKFGPQSIISNNPDATIKDAHFRICWIDVPPALIGDSSRVTHAADIHRVEESGWLSRGKSTFLGKAYVEHTAPTVYGEYDDSAAMQVSSLGKVSTDELTVASIQGLYAKIDDLCAKMDALTVALYDKILTVEAESTPIPSTVTLRAVCTVENEVGRSRHIENEVGRSCHSENEVGQPRHTENPAKYRVPDAATLSLYEQLINFDRSTLRSASSAAVAEERIWAQREATLFRASQKKDIEEETTTLLPLPRSLHDLW